MMEIGSLFQVGNNLSKPGQVNGNNVGTRLML